MLINCVARNLNRLIPTIRNYSQSIPHEKLVIKNQTINYVQSGTGDQTVFCFPGALGTIWSDFKPQIEGLDKTKFTVIAWDPPGYGLSRPPNRVFNETFYETDAEFACDLLQALGVKKVSLLGWSDGGISSMILAAKRPELVDKLVVWGANSYILPEEIQIYEKIRDVSKWSEKMRAPLVELYTEKGLQDIWNGWCDAVSQIQKNRNGDICKKELKNIGCPTLIVHGDKDPMVAPEHPDYLQKNIKNARLHRFPEGKHNIHLRYAPEFNKLVTDFLSNC